MRRLMAVALAALFVTWACSGVLAASRPQQGSLSTSQAADTTWTFTPVARSGVQLVNPDAECAFEVTQEGGAVHYYLLPGNTALMIEGWITSVKAAPTTTQRVGVYATD